jgi:RNA polymerase-interacting CarD/CdnL/TRCF family regulator
MDFNIGDQVMHWTHGLGQIVGLEERTLSGTRILYYAVKVRDMTVWVPADDELDKRLRQPTPASGFKHLFAILSDEGEPLPEDRQERKLRMVEALKDGRAESLCRVIRDLSAYRLGKSLNESDQSLLKRAQTALLGEWSFSLSIPEAQAAMDLFRLLKAEPVEV